MANGKEDDVGGIAARAFAIPAAEVAFVRMADHGLADGRRSSRLMSPKTTRLWPEMKTRVDFARQALSPVDIAPLDRTSAQCLGIANDLAREVTIVRAVRQRLGVSTNRLPGQAGY
ncbi:hypothetical protein IVA77_38855 [Bradyrhizobium sp. 136]|nr:hypothetical protein [Bradyrhizobium sp. 45]MCK1436165.1 hypothetical protein [Bradyrhizobium sp. 15]MCK1613846.1 hypothetical protein [Bradyrhizobium sp. 163]MCK1767352.1 hypothetical protein [Bradyrhizobium sp. 136]